MIINTFNILWKTEFITFISLTLVFLSIVLYITLFAVYLLTKKINIKKITLVISILIFVLLSAVVGCKIYNRITDDWSYKLEDSIKKEFAEVEDINFSFTQNDLMISAYLDQNLSNEQFTQVSDDIFKYLIKYFFFNNGFAESQKSWSKRDRGQYERFEFTFCQTTKNESIIWYTSGYYTNGSRDEINNYKFWTKEIEGNVEQFPIYWTSKP